MKRIILMAALAATFLASACTVRDREVVTRPAPTVVEHY